MADSLLCACSDSLGDHRGKSDTRRSDSRSANHGGVTVLRRSGDTRAGATSSSPFDTSSTDSSSMQSTSGWVLIGIGDVGAVVNIVADAIAIGITTLSCAGGDGCSLLALTSTCAKGNEDGAVTKAIGNVADSDLNLVGSGWGNVTRF